MSPERSRAIQFDARSQLPIAWRNPCSISCNRNKNTPDASWALDNDYMSARMPGLDTATKELSRLRSQAKSIINDK